MGPHDIQRRVMDANQETPGAANMMLAILKALYKFAAKRHRNLEDWTAGIELYEKGAERQAWPDDVLEAALQSDDEPFRRAVTLALYTGQRPGDVCAMTWGAIQDDCRSEEHTSELQSLMRNSYAVFCLKK